MADCNKTVDYLREHNRMCSNYILCDEGCPIFAELEKSCDSAEHEATEEVIRIVQRWSDENPEIKNARSAMIWQGCCTMQKMMKVCCIMSHATDAAQLAAVAKKKKLLLRYGIEGRRNNVFGRRSAVVRME